jgi:hypothetical protein
MLVDFFRSSFGFDSAKTQAAPINSGFNASSGAGRRVYVLFIINNLAFVQVAAASRLALAVTRAVSAVVLPLVSAAMLVVVVVVVVAAAAALVGAMPALIAERRVIAVLIVRNRVKLAVSL